MFAQLELGLSLTCSACEGSGVFQTHGSSVAHDGGPCYRCGGTGVQTEADRKRNAAYDAIQAKRREAERQYSLDLEAEGAYWTALAEDAGFSVKEA